MKLEIAEEINMQHSIHHVQATKLGIPRVKYLSKL